MATTNYWLQPDRQLDIRGTILFGDNTTKSLTSADIIRYEINRQNSLSGFPLGECISGAFTLEIDNADHTLEQNVLYGAKITIEIGIYYTNAWHWSPFGVWFVSEVDAQEQSTTATITGYDAIGTYFDRPIDVSIFNNITVQDTVTRNGVTYHKIKIRDVISKICEECNCTYSTTSGTSSVYGISSTATMCREDIKTFIVFENNVTYRALMNTYAAMGDGFYHIDNSNTLVLGQYASYSYNPVITLDPSTYITYAKSNVKNFETFYVEYKQKLATISNKYDPVSGINATWNFNTRYSVGVSSAVPQQNTPKPDAYNTLFCGNIYSTFTNSSFTFYAATSSQHLQSESASCEFQGDPTLILGKRAKVIDKSNTEHIFNITSLSATFDGGLSMTIGCEIPDSLDSDFKPFSATTSSQSYITEFAEYSSVENQYNPDDY